MDDEWDVEGSARWIGQNRFPHVALQFPDELLPQAPSIAAALDRRIRSLYAAQSFLPSLYILADSTYNPLEVDEVAASHVSARAVVHYGRAALTPVTTLPSYFVFGRKYADVDDIVSTLEHTIHALVQQGELDLGSEDESSRPLSAACGVVLLDQPLVHYASQLEAAIHALHLPIHLSVALPTARELWPRGDHKSPPSPPPPPPPPPPPSSSTSSPPVSSAAETPCCMRTAPNASCCHDDSVSPCASSLSPPPVSVAGYTWAHLPSLLSDHARAETAMNLSRRQLCILIAARNVEGEQMDASSSSSSSSSSSASPLCELQMTLQCCRWMSLDPSSKQEGRAGDTTCLVEHGLAPETRRLLKRRYFLVEKARIANIVGILIGTLGVAGFLDAAERVRYIAEASGKKTYTVVMGKPNPAKLGNFPEVEVWVHIASSQGLLLECRDYLSPIITPFEAELAFGDLDWTPHWSPLAFHSMLLPAKGEDEEGRDGGGGGGSGAERKSPRFSLLTGHVIPPHNEQSDTTATFPHRGTRGMQALVAMTDRALTLREATASAREVVVAKSSAEYLVSKRSFQGLETPSATGANRLEAQLAVPGLSGRAATYQNEGTSGGGGSGSGGG